MLFRTHLAIALFTFLVFFSYIGNPLVFLPVFLIATIIPDIDTPFSKIGHYRLFRVLNFFTKHRGMIHSFSFILLLSIPIFLFCREILLPFALGYSLHLLLDTFTLNGIILLYPFKFKARGKMKTGGITEYLLWWFFIIVDSILLFYKIYLIVK